VFFAGLMLAALAFASSGRAAMETPPPPSVWSDKADYAPGETVTLSGANWAPGESVHIRVNDDAGQTWSRDVDVTAAEDGTISDQFDLPGWFVAVYNVTATGASGVATWTFTDGAVRVRAVFTPSGPASTSITWVRYNNTTCNPGVGNANVIDSGTLIATTGGNGGNLPVDVSGTQSVRFTAGAVTGYSFLNWSSGNFTTGTFTPTSNPGCLVGAGNTQNTQVNYSGNNAPVCNSGNATTAEDNSVATPLSCSDADGNPLTYTIVSGPSSGTLSGTAASLTYNPGANFNGSDSFTFKANDGTVDSNVATFSVTVTEVNDAPTANADSKSVAEDATLSFAASTLTANDSAGPANESGQALIVTAVTATASTHGTVSLVAGTVTYTPDPDFNGAASFNYTVQDNGTTNGVADFKQATGTVNVTVTEVNDTPSANADSKSVAEDGSLSFPASDLTANDSPGPANESGQTLTVLSVAPIAGDTHGSVSLVAGTVTYAPAANYNGPAKFHYTIRDNGTTNGISDPKENTGDVNVTVTAVNDDPTITRDNASVSVNEGQIATNSGTFNDVDLGDSPPDHVTVSASVGTVTQNDGAKTWSWSYIPPDGPSSSTVTVTATDDAGADASVTFSLTVANVAPNPAWTSYSNILYGPLVFGLTGSWAGSFTDPGVNDDPWTATFAWGGVNDPSQTKTYGASDPKTFSVRPNFTSAGCGLTGSVTVTDKDGASGSDAKTVSVGTGEFMPPMTNQPVTDKLKNGQVLPVKVRIADCNGNPIAGLSPSIVLKEGDLTSEVSDNTIDPITVTSVSAADTTGVMRAADGFYIYNLRVNVPRLNTPYTVIITPNIGGYPSSMTLRHKIIATK
jgi:hypothetical protein